MPEQPELFIGRLDDETFFILASSLGEAKTLLSEILNLLMVERNDNKINWFQTQSMVREGEPRVFLALDNHLGLTEASGESSLFLVITPSNEELFVVARSNYEVLELLTNWMKAEDRQPPLNFAISELQEKVPWVYQRPSKKK